MSRFSVSRICDCEILRRYLAKAASQSVVVDACIRVYVVELRVCRCSYENQYPTTDRPTDRPTHRPNRAQTHMTAPSPLSLSLTASCISNPPITDPFRAHLPSQRTTHHFFNPHSTRTDQLGSPATYVGWETPLKRLHTNASALMRFYK